MAFSYQSILSSYSFSGMVVLAFIIWKPQEIYARPEHKPTYFCIYPPWWPQYKLQVSIKGVCPLVYDLDILHGCVSVEVCPSHF